VAPGNFPGDQGVGGGGECGVVGCSTEGCTCNTVASVGCLGALERCGCLQVDTLFMGLAPFFAYSLQLDEPSFAQLAFNAFSEVRRRRRPPTDCVAPLVERLRCLFGASPPPALPPCPLQACVPRVG
jgi:hypothetical protein